MKINLFIFNNNNFDNKKNKHIFYIKKIIKKKIFSN